MADKSMPDERNRHPDATAPTGAADDCGDASVARTSESAVAASKDGNERVDAPEPPSTKVSAPLITAVEIENFKGIGHPMRVEFRPITLLLGNNSAGKSTVLHALCYAHEILSHRNVDVHETEIGGDRIDLGGFSNLVHAHDPARPVRLRFDLNLEDWSIPEGLDEKLVSPLDPMGGDAHRSLFHGSERPSSGWIELQARLTDDQQPVLSSYELGVNDARVGRLLRRQPTGVSLEFDPTHPLLERSLRPRRVVDCNIPEGTTEVPEADRRASRVRESTGADGGGWKESRMEVLGLFTPLPHWNEIPLLDDHGQSDAGGYDLDEFTAMVSALFVGIGQALRDELARVRYIGPVRDLNPKTTIASSARRRAFETFAADFIHGGGASGTRPAYPASWADGSAAWIYLHDTPHRTLLDEVNTWLERRDRLDTGYALRVRSKVTIYEDEAGVLSEMREYHQLRQTFGNAEGSVDLAAWSRAEAEAMVDTIDPDGTKAALGHCDQLREIFAGAAEGTSIAESVDELAREVLQDIIEKFESIDIKPGIRREAERNLRLVEDLRRLLTLSTQEIESQITGAGEDMVDSSEKLTDAYCRRLSDLLRRWEGDAPKWIYMAGIVDGLRAMFGRDDLPDEVEAWTRKMEDSRDQAAVSGEVERFLGEFRAALQASVASANRNYRRLTALVAKMEGGRLSSPEIDKLAAALAARQPQREVDLVTTRNRLPVRVPDVGVGISQILPVVVAALDPGSPGITAIEQPELHLHPRIQVELGDLFAQQINRGGIFLIETHSEHLLLRFMKRMRQTSDGTLPDGSPEVRPEDIAVLFVETDPNGEQTLIREMPLNERGELVKAWPGGFFEEDLQEIF
ncbi:MAG: AAA family ATPase [Acidobacteria bacterium]|nr:AAA family ATPase [Acidobacteriota bacterium]